MVLGSTTQEASDEARGLAFSTPTSRQPIQPGMPRIHSADGRQQPRLSVSAQEWPRSGPEPVKPVETTCYADLMSASGVGSLIQATVGSFGGSGRRCPNRAGFAA